MDGKDIGPTYGIFIESGSDDFLRFPARKPSITHDWQDANGLDVDLSQPFFEDKKISLRCAMVASSKEQFWRNYDAFIGEWAKPGTRDWTVVALERSFPVYYVDCSDFDRLTKWNGGPKLIARFTLNIAQMASDVSDGNAYIVDEDNRYLVS